MDRDTARESENRMAQSRYDERRASALMLVVVAALVMAIGLILFGGDGQNQKSGGRAEAPPTSTAVPN